jgi:hypothetical protein
MMFPARTAREIPTFGSNGDPVEICWRWLLTVVPHHLNHTSQGSDRFNWLALIAVSVLGFGLFRESLQNIRHVL